MADIVTNPKARRDYHILETFEAGIVLHGTEVKALRAGKGQIADAYALVDDGEVFLHNAHIEEYSHGNLQNHAPKAARKLLLHKKQIRELWNNIRIKGMTVVPIRVYLKDGRAKIEIALAKGKKAYDKRATIAKRDEARSADRETRAR